jgi:hypothetical protein
MTAKWRQNNEKLSTLEVRERNVLLSLYSADGRWVNYEYGASVELC